MFGMKKNWMEMEAVEFNGRHSSLLRHKNFASMPHRNASLHMLARQGQILD